MLERVEQEHWGFVEWCDEDVVLQEHDIDPARELIRRVRTRQADRHIDDFMVDGGWEAKDDAIDN